MSLKLFRMAVTSATRANKRPASPTLALSLSPTRHRSSLTNVPTTPFESSPKKVKYQNGEKVSEKPKKAYIALGSNMGDRVAMIEEACKEMSSRGVKVTRTSSLWETEPMYVLDQERFVNGACEVETHLTPLALLDLLQSVENDMGRKKVIDKGPRNIDLDILLYENDIITHPRLNIPHIGIAEREFVLRPLAQILPHSPLHPSKPWKLASDYLNALPLSESPISTLTPLRQTSTSPSPILHALQPKKPTHLMAILNLTPDSFSDGGSNTLSNLSTKISNFISAGFTLFDIGGQSTAPGAPEVIADEEISRVLPAIAAIRAHPQGKDVVISIDTYRASVARAALDAGADIINDVSFGLLDADMLPLIAEKGCSYIGMHMRGTPATMSKAPHTEYPSGLIPTIAKELLERVRIAEEAGIKRWRLILDPGIGFAKTGEQNLEILRHLEELRNWPGLEGIPWLVGASRKRFIGQFSGSDELLEKEADGGKVEKVGLMKARAWGTAATVTAAVQGGADIVRVHDVEMAAVARMSDAIYQY